MIGPPDPEDLLRAVRPEPRAGFVDELERRVLPERRPRSVPRLVAAAAAVAALGLVLAVLSIAGGLPAPLQQGGRADAKDTCTTVLIERIERVPRFVVGRDDELRLTYRRQVVTRSVTRCR